MSGLLAVEPQFTERRRHPRYPMRLELHYRLPDVGDANAGGSGRTVNISSGGVLFEADRPLPLRKEIVLDVFWPARLDGVRDLKFVVHGKIVRSEGKTVAMRIKRSEFRTRRSTK